MAEHPEAWLRGPIEGVDPLLTPVAHAFVQTAEDVERAARALSPSELWRAVGGAASVGFHIRHLCGSTDRLCTLARGERLSDSQRSALAAEHATPDPLPDAPTLVAGLRSTIEAAIAQLRATPAASLAEVRAVGRATSTTIGLLVHAAEHAQRHAGQVVTTVKILQASRASGG
jgi:DinB family protein